MRNECCTYTERKRKREKPCHNLAPIGLGGLAHSLSLTTEKGVNFNYVKEAEENYAWESRATNFQGLVLSLELGDGWSLSFSLFHMSQWGERWLVFEIPKTMPVCHYQTLLILYRSDRGRADGKRTGVGVPANEDEFIFMCACVCCSLESKIT